MTRPAADHRHGYPRHCTPDIREQIPITPTRALTYYKAQGQTLKRVHDETQLPHTDRHNVDCRCNKARHMCTLKYERRTHPHEA
jgi:hypothetical protein